MHHQIVQSRLRLEETRILKEEAADALCQRYRLSPEVARRIVEMSRNVDQAYAIAELMR